MVPARAWPPCPSKQNMYFTQTIVPLVGTTTRSSEPPDKTQFRPRGGQAKTVSRYLGQVNPENAKTGGVWSTT